MQAFHVHQNARLLEYMLKTQFALGHAVQNAGLSRAPECQIICLKYNLHWVMPLKMQAPTDCPGVGLRHIEIRPPIVSRSNSCVSWVHAIPHLTHAGLELT
jgi:hypothetical protein